MNYQDKVAVITGAASGIGRGLAERCALEKMFIVLADINREGSEETSRILSNKGAKHIIAPTDVAHANQVDALAKNTLEAFGQVDVVFNNAGVLLTGRSWELTEQDWDWVININLKGVINGIRTFTPIMLDQNTSGI